MATDPTIALCPECQHPIASSDTTCPTCGHMHSAAADNAGASTSTPAAAESSPASEAEETLPTSEGGESQDIMVLDEATADNLPALEESPAGTAADPSDTTAEMAEGQPSPDTAVLLVEQPASQLTASDTPSAPRTRFTSQPRSRIIKLVLIGAAVLLVLSVTGAGILFALTRPQPLITVTSDYHVGSIPAGSTSTTLHVEGRQFSSYSGIIFLLDGQPAPGSQVIPSDEHGTFEADLPITARWTLGAHQLTARDMNGYTTHVSSKVMVVQQGQANTPGPTGAPADDTARFTLWITSTPSIAGFAAVSYLGGPVVLTVQGQPDPAGGSVCDLATDDGKAHTSTNSLPSFRGTNLPGGVNFTEIIAGLSFLQKVTTAYTCSGLYQNGKIGYTETNTIDTEVYSSGVTCKLGAPRVIYQLQGAFNSATTASGTYSVPASELKCSDGSTEKTTATTGIWMAVSYPTP